MNRRVALVAMPWATVYTPSIQLGILTSVVRECGFEPHPLSYFVAFCDFIAERTKRLDEDERLGVAEYSVVSERLDQAGAGDWIFANVLEPSFGEREKQAYFSFLARERMPELRLQLLTRMREHAKPFVELCAREIVACEPLVVGFSTTFSQNVPSLAVAKRVRELAPQIPILFGGANVEGEMGKALHAAYPFIDYILQGECERSLPALLESLAGGIVPSGIAGLVSRESGTQISAERSAGAVVTMADVPAPDYDEFFARLRGTSIRGLIEYEVNLPVESSRGCWWGAKSHCTFCGLNGTTMTFRAKGADAFADEIRDLSERYRRVRFEAVDNIIDMQYFETFLPTIEGLRNSGSDITFFYETKANLKKKHLDIFSRSGVVSIQPGIESLSTPILKLMRKGVTALQNVRLLKWASEYGIDVRWNLIWGFPREEPSDYDAMVALMPSLGHLQAPSPAPLQLQRFSPFYDRADELGIVVQGASEKYRHLYAVDESTLANIAYSFEFAYGDPHDDSYVRPLRRAIGAWAKNFAEKGTSLTMNRGPGFVRIHDRRPGMPQQEYLFRGVAAALYLACDAGATHEELRSIVARRDPETADAELAVFLNMLDVRRLAFVENDVVLGLAVSKHPLVSYADVIEELVRDAETSANAAALVS